MHLCHKIILNNWFHDSCLCVFQFINMYEGKRFTFNGAEASAPLIIPGIGILTSGSHLVRTTLTTLCSKFIYLFICIFIHSRKGCFPINLFQTGNFFLCFNPKLFEIYTVSFPSVWILDVLNKKVTSLYWSLGCRFPACVVNSGVIPGYTAVKACIVWDWHLEQR